MSVVLTAPIPGVNTPNFPFGGAMLTGLRILFPPFIQLVKWLPGFRARRTKLARRQA